MKEAELPSPARHSPLEAASCAPESDTHEQVPVVRSTVQQPTNAGSRATLSCSPESSAGGCDPRSGI
eukprot:4709211-Alexandrium_andersonii.AAC.1